MRPGSRLNSYKRMIARQRQTYGEEVANVLTHGAGMFLGLTAIVVFDDGGYPKRQSLGRSAGFAVYAVCMTLFVCDIYILPCFDPCTAEKAFTPVRP